MRIEWPSVICRDNFVTIDRYKIMLGKTSHAVAACITDSDIVRVHLTENRENLTETTDGLTKIKHKRDCNLRREMF